MVTSASGLRRTFRITIDVETTVHATPRETGNSSAESLHFHQALVEQLAEHPRLLDQLLRAAATDALKRAEPLLALEYGWGKVSEQGLLQALVAKLEPAAQAHFQEEIEAGIAVPYFDEYDATIKRFQLTELAEQ